MILETLHELKTFTVKLKSICDPVWNKNAASGQSVWCDWSAVFYFWCLSNNLALKVGMYDCSCTEYKQCVGTMETARRAPTGHRGLLCDISITYDIINYGVMEMGIISPFHVWRSDWMRMVSSPSSLMWGYKNVVWSDTESVISTDPKVGKFPADTVM